MSRELIDKIAGEQEAKKLTDKEVAVMLGVSRARWQYARTHPDGALGVRMLRGIRKAFPQFKKEVDKDLQGVRS